MSDFLASLPMSQYGQTPAAPGTAPGAPAPGPTPGGNPFTMPVIAGLVGGFLAFLGSFLTWTTAEIGGESETIGGMDGDGLWVLITALLTVALFAAGAFLRKTPLSLAGGATALIALVFGVLNFLDPERLARQSLESEIADSGEEAPPSEMIDELLGQFDFSTGAGLYLVLLGSLVAVGSAVFAGLQLRKRP